MTTYIAKNKLRCSLLCHCLYLFSCRLSNSSDTIEYPPEEMEEDKAPPRSYIQVLWGQISLGCSRVAGHG